MPDPDQVQESEQAESETVSTTDAETEEDQQEAQTEEEQSTESEEKRYKLNVDGKEQELTADEIHEWAQKVNPEFTRRSQELAEFRRQEKERKTRAGSEARQTIEEDKILAQTPPHVKAALEKLIQTSVDKSFQRYDQTQEQVKRDKAFEEKLDTLEKEFDGKADPNRPERKIKFDRKEVVLAMQQPGNTNFNPRSVFKELREAEFDDLKVKRALKKQKGGVETERTGTTGPRKPQKKVPKTFQDAAKSFSARLRQST